MFPTPWDPNSLRVWGSGSGGLGFRVFGVRNPGFGFKAWASGWEVFGVFAGLRSFGGLGFRA